VSEERVPFKYKVNLHQLDAEASKLIFPTRNKMPIQCVIIDDDDDDNNPVKFKYCLLIRH
jgi:hypothetical protein